MTTAIAERPLPSNLITSLRNASPLFWRTSMAFLAAFAICMALQAVDPRLFNGISVWVKPAKFFLSLAVHMLTLGFGLTLLPERIRQSLGIRIAVVTMASMAILEMIYIAFRAARAEASHFNISSEVAALLYNAMGAGAAAMMLATAWIGWQVLRHGPRSLLGRATGSGFVIAAVLTLIVGFTLGGMGSHWIGGDQTDATGLPLLGWSTTGGDLRIAHFIGLHVMQVLPVAALFSNRSLVLTSGLLVAIAAAATYAQALMGLPLIAL